MYTNIFGQTFKRNPNLIDTFFTDSETDLLKCFLIKVKDMNLGDRMLDLLIDPIQNKFLEKDNLFLISELRFLKKLLKDFRQVLLDCETITVLNISIKLTEYLSDNNIRESRKLVTI